MNRNFDTGKSKSLKAKSQGERKKKNKKTHDSETGSQLHIDIK